VADLYEYERLISGHLPATFYYGRFLSEMKCRMYQQALEDIDRAIRLSPREALFHLQRAVLLYSVGETTEAISSAQKSVELAPDFAEAYRILGICQMENKDTEVGKNNLKKAAELGDETAKRLLEE
jgi:tetratricopeptide (TPR) repeat protein